MTGDCRLPLLHKDHSGLMRPQKAGPGMKKKNEISFSEIMERFSVYVCVYTIHIAISIHFTPNYLGIQKVGYAGPTRARKGHSQ